MARSEQENKMGIMPENKLLLNMAVPMILSMLVQALYNVVDSYFVSQLSEDALNAVSLAFPVQNLMISVSVGTGVGINALLSRTLGQKDQERANHTAMNGVLLEGLSCLVFTILGLTCSRLFYTVQTDIPGIVNYGTDYLTIVAGVSVGLFMAVASERLVQATGRTVYAMITQGIGSIVNLILDPILIFGLFGFPRLEVAGAAIATVTGQILGGLVGVYFNLAHNPELQLSLRHLRPDKNIIGGIYSVGLPSIVMQSIGSVMVFGMNQILIAFTSTATAVFGVYFKLQSLIFMPVFGLTNGMVPIVAYNYGARKPMRIIKTIRLSVAYAMGIMAVGCLLFQLFPDVFLSLFEAETEVENQGALLEIGVPALRTISYCFIAAGFGIVSSSVFQALGHGVLSLVISVVRQLVCLLPAAFLLARLGLDAVWWAFPFAEIFSMILTSLFLYRVYQKKIAPLRSPV
ncbi:MAG: MATE family efflux transporter [Lawsonibacter sp.]|nr:MATE family efflux transporter [Lawsonibacter sp.]